MVKDIQGKEMPLLKVVVETIKYLKQEMIKDIAIRIDKLEDTDVLYVLTVPAIWTDSAKAFMRQAAEEVNMLTVAAIKNDSTKVYMREAAEEGMSFTINENFLFVVCNIWNNRYHLCLKEPPKR